MEHIPNRESDRHMVVDFNEPRQEAWSVSNREGGSLNSVALCVKSKVHLAPGYEIPKLNLTILTQYRWYSLLLIGLLGLFVSLVSIIQIGCIGFFLFAQSNTMLYPLIILLVSLVLFPILVYTTIRILLISSSERTLLPLSISSGSFLNYVLAHLIHLIVICLFGSFLLIFSRENSIAILPTFSSYMGFVLFSLVITAVSPFFRVSKILATLRQTGLYHNFSDAFQFTKFSSKKTFSMMFISYLIPSLIIVSSLELIVEFFDSLFGDSSILAWKVVLFAIIFIIFYVITVASLMQDADLVKTYESNLSKVCDPPSIDWLKKAKEKTLDSEENQFIDVLDDSYLHNKTETECPYCSNPLPLGTIFCVACGKKVKK